jgi:hypothetical protein
MAINTTWNIEIGPEASRTDFTSRVMSMNVRQSVDVNVIGRGQAVITLLNKDGALTPGGGGTYSSTDWFSQGMYINVLTDVGGAQTEEAVFHGVIVDFSLQDDGVFSTVTITALDGLTVAAKTVGSLTIQSAKAYNTFYNEFVDRNGIVFPRLGGTNAEGIVSSEYPYTQPIVGLAFAQVIRPTTYADGLQTYLIPSVNDVTWATNITSSSSVTNYNIISLGQTTTRSNASPNRQTYEFAPAGSVVDNKLPFLDDGFVQEFNNDTLITQAQIAGSITGATTQTATASTNPTYGNRTVQYTSTLTETDTVSLEVATRLVNRYSTSRFSPTQLRTSASLVESQAKNAAEDEWRYLLSIKYGLWQQLVVTWTGSGAASQTAYCIVKGRTINVTPSDTIVTLQLGNWADNHGFILNTDRLDIDRLG